MIQRRARVSLLLAGLLAACANDAGQGTGSLTDEVRPDVAPGEYFVAFKTTPGGAQRELVRAYGASIKHEFAAETKAFAIKLEDAAKVAALTAHGSVDYVEAVPMRYKNGLADAELVPALGNGLYGLVTTGAVAVQGRGIRGAGVKVGVADEGLQCDHPDIAANFGEARDFVGYEPHDPCSPMPGESHGTHVGGTILGVDNRVGVLGVAPQAELFHARVLGSEGGSTADIMAGVRWLVVEKGVRVVNLSLGGGHASRTEAKFYDEMRARGVLVVAASGNESARKVGYPAAYTPNISVGAVDRNDVRADFSNIGRGLDVTAPGVNVVSSVAFGQGSEASVTAGGQSYFASGMEFAPHTSGVTGTLVDCGLGASCPASASGNIALIQRGDTSFAEKVTVAMNAGATAAIIYNNVAGDFGGTLGAEGTWIPAVSVSDTTGASLRGQLGSSVTVVSEASDWDHYSGTSMATPHTAGTIALIWSAAPSLTADQVEAALKNTAHDLGAAGYDTSYGYGRIDADAAVASTGH